MVGYIGIFEYNTIMSLWLALAIVGQLLNAIVALFDKYIVTSETVVFRPFVYAFYVSVLSSGAILVYFFSWLPLPIDGLSMPSFANVSPPDLIVLAFAILAGYTFFSALMSFFDALRLSDASDVVPVTGGLTAFFTLLFSYMFLETSLPREFMGGFFLLMLGTILISQFRFSWQVMLSTTHASLMFGLHYVVFKSFVELTNFDNAFLWTRLGIVFIALSMLLIPEYWHKITARTSRAKGRDGLLVVGNKVLAGFASIIILKAIEFGDVALVQALGGLQYLFLLIISVIFGSKLNRDFGENLTTQDMIHKTIAIPLIAFGFFLLFI